MFDHVGKVLKTLAKIWMFLCLFAGILLAVLLWLFIAPDALRSIRLVTLLFGIFAGGMGGFIYGYFSSILLYAFGELVDTNTEINKKLDYYLGNAEEDSEDIVEEFEEDVQ